LFCNSGCRWNHSNHGAIFFPSVSLSMEAILPHPPEPAKLRLRIDGAAKGLKAVSLRPSGALLVTERGWRGYFYWAFLDLPCSPRHRVSGFRAVVPPCRRHPWRLFLPLVGGRNPSSPERDRQRKNPLDGGSFVGPSWTCPTALGIVSRASGPWFRPAGAIPGAFSSPWSAAKPFKSEKGPPTKKPP
jgi:hypothetical protein